MAIIRASWRLVSLLVLVAGLGSRLLAAPANTGGPSMDRHQETTLDQVYASQRSFLWHISLAEQAGVQLASQGNLGFVQFGNSVGLAFELGQTPGQVIGWGGGLGLEYFAALPSAIGPATPLIMPGFDAIKLKLFGSLYLPEGLVLRFGPHAAFAQVQITGLSLFWLGADLQAGWQFQLGWLGIEPGLVASLQFRKDLDLAASLAIQVRLSLLGEQVSKSAPASEARK